MSDVPRAHRAPGWLVAIAAAFILLWLAAASLPFLWTLWGSFKVEGDFFSLAGWRDAVTGPRTLQATGSRFTLEAYRDVWIEQEFWRPALNTIFITLGVTTASLTFGTLGGYALARSNEPYAFWVLIAALVFRAMPALTLVSGYLLPFFEWNLWGHRWTTVIVLVALNQPFTLWLLHSFFLTIPRDLDESALCDGCTRFQAFRLAIMPVMWPGVITTGIFSFLVGYSDFVICAMLLTQENQTMVPTIVGFLGTTQQPGQFMYAVAATVSVVLPLMVLVLFSQRRIVGGLVAGAVKG
ncbi:MAG TPA: carbohydrate ABC transporter permease [Rubellimicrobium sp.]|nr:carbohydrate ABC transporter permease [Rubellimicrobium sp.]